MTYSLVFLVEVECDGKWVPMFAPCYTAAEAQKKAKVKMRTFGFSRVRVAVYERKGTVS